MPYIKQERQVFLDRDDHSDQEDPKNAGELNYVLTTIIRDYFYGNGGRYQQINDIMGALEGAKTEFYRRVAAPYEDEKIKTNGDVYF